MALEFRQTQKQLQKLLLTPQMQQSLYILQLPTQELRALIVQELENNPVLEEIEDEVPPPEEPSRREESLSPDLQQISDEDDTWQEYISQKEDGERGQEKRNYRESLITKGPSCQEEMLHQLALGLPDKESRQIGEFILGNLDESGYLEISQAEIAHVLGVRREQVEKVLKAIQRLEPVGIASRDLRECLLIQLEHAGEKETLAYLIVERSLSELGKKRYGSIAKALGASLQAVKEAHQRIGRLEPRPGQRWSCSHVGYLTPDLLITHKDDRYELTFVNEGLPSIRINPLYKDLLKGNNPPKETREFLKGKLKEAARLIHCLNQRRETIAKVVKAVIEFQKEFLEKGVEYLKPLTLKEVATLVGCHESTVSRVVMNKVIETPHGCFPLKFFFDRSPKVTEGETLASKGVMALIEGWIRKEDSKHPLSDQEIVERLKKENLTVARRTVAKYRQAMKILPSYLRKK